MIRRILAVVLSIALLCLCALISCDTGIGTGLVSTSVNLESTDELIIYNPYYLNSSHWANQAIKRFTDTYPHVKVRVEVFRIDPNDPSPLMEEQYERRMSTELLAGEGPDVVFLDAKYFDNIDKLAASGYFADLNPYFKADPDYDADNYYQPVFNAGLADGKRAFVPYRFRVYSYVSSEERLQAVGIDPDRITDMVSLLEEAGRALPAAGVPDLPIYERMLTMVGSALARREAGEGYLASGALRTFLTALKPCYQYAQPWQGATNPYLGLPLSLPVHQMLNGKFLFVSCDTSSDWVFNRNTVQDGVAHMWDESFQQFEEYYKMFSHKTPIETPVTVTFTNPESAVSALISDALAINTGAKNKANAYNFIKMLLNHREDKTYTGSDLVSKELNLQNTANLNDVEKLNPEEDLLATQVADVVFESPAVVTLLKECMLPFLNDEEGYESCEAALHERLRMYWGE